MNILFLLRSNEIGRLEVVTTVLANKFRSEGHHVFLWAFYEAETSLRERLDESIPVIYGEGYKVSSENVSSLRQCLVDYSVNVVVNQWGLPYIPAKTLRKASKGLDVKIIAVYHNDPSTNGKLKDVETVIEKTNSVIKLAFLRFKHWCYRQITSASMRYVYKNSDVYMVLSPSFVEGFKKFTGLKNVCKLAVQTNPVTIDTSHSTECFAHKKKEILFVGRLDNNQKRVSRIIETWASLESKYPDRHLSIVGDGPAREYLIRLTETLGLEHVSFEGFQSPRPYYERASLLMLASEFEGFPLVLAECMSFGVVPVVYGSYSAVYDIIEDGKDGLIIPKTSEGFNAAIMAERMAAVMTDEHRLEQMALAAIEKSKNYSIDKIYQQWMRVIAAFEST